MDAAISITGLRKDLGGFDVARLLPQRFQRSIGPFVFLDHMGPAQFAPGQGIDVRPHPHIGLATVTFLFDGAMMHRDSLGSVQEIRPGDVNWMNAGRGIVHSERSPAGVRSSGGPLHVSPATMSSFPFRSPSPRLVASVIANGAQALALALQA